MFCLRFRDWFCDSLCTFSIYSVINLCGLLMVEFVVRGIAQCHNWERSSLIRCPSLEVPFLLQFKTRQCAKKITVDSPANVCLPSRGAKSEGSYEMILLFDSVCTIYRKM